MRLIAAELMKINRWSTWLLVGITALFQLLVGYVLVYFIAQIPGDGDGGGIGSEALLLTLAPDYVVAGSMTTLATLGGALALVIGALLSAREYGWRTVTMLLTQGPTRLQVFAAKVAALALVIVIMVVLTFVASGFGVLFVSAQTGDGLSGLPAFSEVLIGAATGCLIVGPWAALGYALGWILRSTGLAVGLGLVYALVIETIISGFGVFNDIFENISRGMIGPNGSALAASFGPELPEQFGVPSIDPTIAALVLTAYLVVALVASALVFARRDVT